MVQPCDLRSPEDRLGARHRPDGRQRPAGRGRRAPWPEDLLHRRDRRQAARTVRQVRPRAGRQGPARRGPDRRPGLRADRHQGAARRGDGRRRSQGRGRDAGGRAGRTGHHDQGPADAACAASGRGRPGRLAGRDRPPGGRDRHRLDRRAGPVGLRPHPLRGRAGHPLGRHRGPVRRRRARAGLEYGPADLAGFPEAGLVRRGRQPGARGGHRRALPRRGRGPLRHPSVRRGHGQRLQGRRRRGGGRGVPRPRRRVLGADPRHRRGVRQARRGPHLGARRRGVRRVDRDPSRRIDDPRAASRHDDPHRRRPVPEGLRPAQVGHPGLDGRRGRPDRAVEHRHHRGRLPERRLHPGRDPAGRAPLQGGEHAGHRLRRHAVDAQAVPRPVPQPRDPDRHPAGGAAERGSPRM